MKKITKVPFALLIVLSFFMIGCFGSKDDDPAACTPTAPTTYSLSSGSTVTVSGLNSKANKYSILYAQPAAQPESNSGPSTHYSFDFNSVNGSYIAPANSIASLKNERSLASKDLVYSAAQIASDEKMRQSENEALASMEPQLSKIPEGMNPAPPASPVVGTTWNSVNISASSWVTINTTCRYVSSHAYFFVDNRDISAMSSYLAGYGTAFDAIYNVNHTKFGTENDTDGNGKVIIVFTRELTGGLLGYFYAIDKYPKATYTYSNEGDIFYMTCDAAYQGAIVNGTLAHEFQHMIYFDQHYNHSVFSTYSWLNEALSQAAEYYNGYTVNHLAWIKNYLTGDNWEGLSLTHWTSSNYGYGALFVRYLIDQYGDTAIYNMCSTANIGITAVESATGVADFNTIFNNFAQAVALSSSCVSSTNPLYKFTTLNLAAVQTSGRGGLTTDYYTGVPAGYDFSGWWLYAYELWLINWTGNFGTMNLTGTDIKGTAFGY
jgi:hypothetical protein